MSDVTPEPVSVEIVSERGHWQRNLIILALFLNILLQVINISEINENESRSREGRPLLCALAFDDALAERYVAIAYEDANCHTEFMPLPEDR